MKWIIQEEGEKVNLHNMMYSEVEKMQHWGYHKDRLYADYDFPVLSDELMKSWYRCKTAKKRLLVSICDKKDNLIGYISLRDTNRLFKTSVLGIVLDPDKIEKGYGTDAIRTFIRWYFNKLRYKKLYLSVAMYNTRAQRVYEKIGFKEKYKYYDEFFNLEIDPLKDPQYNEIKKYFKRFGKTIFVKCKKMEISMLSTE